MFQSPIPDADMLKAAGAEVLVLGVTKNVSVAQIAAISSSPHKQNETWWLASQFTDMTQFVQSLISGTCTTICEASKKSGRPV